MLTTIKNKTIDKINGWLANLSNAGVAGVEALIIADVPWLGVPVIKQIWQMLFGWIAGYFITGIRNALDFGVIDVQVGGESSALSKELKAVADAYKSGDPDAIHKAILAYAEAHSALSNLDGGAAH